LSFTGSGEIYQKKHPNLGSSPGDNEVIKLARRHNDSAFVKEYDLKKHKFMTMAEEKRERIIEAALQEFLKGYMAASTDAIVKEAGISKGLLFHYFGSKRGLFLFLIKYALDATVSASENIISESNDFLENLRIISQVKADMTKPYSRKALTVKRRKTSLYGR
jgi:TetR/AcrR family transcriptional regulator